MSSRGPVREAGWAIGFTGLACLGLTWVGAGVAFAAGRDGMD